MSYCTKNKIIIILLSLLLLTLPGSTILAQAPTASVGVFYIGPEDIVAEAINLAHPYIVRVDQPELAQVIVINNARISEDGLRFYGDQVRNNRIGLVIFSGNLFPEDLSDLAALMGISTFGMTKLYTPSTVVVEDEVDQLPESVTWSSAPEINARTVISNPNILLPLISTETGQPIIQRVRGREQAQTLIVGGWLDDPSNASWRDWPYYQYLVYRLINDAAGRSRTLKYADFPLSPVPQRNGRWGIAITGIAIIIGTAAVFYLARRFRFMRSSTWQYHTAPQGAYQPGSGGWGSAGFHRPLASMLILLPLNMILFFLLVRYRLHTLPDVIVSDANTLSSWQIIEHWAEVIWLLLDAGTGIAAVKYFASLHVRHPRRAFHYFQFYGWWQLFIGAIQLGIVAILSATIIPGARFAHLTYFILIQSVIRFPGFLTVFVLLFRAMQRLDYEQYLSFFMVYGSVAFQIFTYLIFIESRTALPSINLGQMSIVALGAGLYAAEWLIFILGTFLYLRQGYVLEALILPISDVQAGRHLLGFGIRAALGTLALPLGTLLQISVFKNVLPELSPVWKNWILAVQVAYVFDLLLRHFYQNMMPAFAEAIALNYKTMLRYYMTQGVRYGMWLSVFIFVVFASLGQQIVNIVFTPADSQVGEVILLLLAVTAFRWGIWLVDSLLLASERPGLRSALTILEQILAVGGGLYLAPQWGILGFLSAYAIAFLIRFLLTWILMQRLIIRVHIYIWQTLVSPLISGMLIYYLLHVILEQITLTWQTGFVLTALPVGLWIYALFSAIFGGWDDAGIRELGRAVRMSGIGKPYAWVLWQCIRLGARISPLHGRFPIAIAGIAEEQATAITYTRSATR